MLLHDLHGNIPPPDFFSALKNKVNETYVKYKGKWCYCCLDEDITFKYGKSKSFKLHSQGPKGEHKVITVTSLEHIDTEPEWPAAGMYFIDNCSVSVKYNPTQSWKAGLSPKIVTLLSNEKSINIYGYTTMFNKIDKHGFYPSLVVARQRLLKGIRRVPLSLDLCLDVHPFVDAPVIYYGPTAIAKVRKDNTLVISESAKQIEEQLENIGDIEYE